ncbi:MAG: hypothetical protein A2W17_09240 [Planctomycetes bacterium RBG_16_41_13]|nr:MAG: hypothetical protein A2W17_09240 [Planctomycetes bacterium RBG_16_41_13]
MSVYRDTDVLKLEERIKELENDITKLRQVEEKLKESENSLANAQKIAHLGNWEWDIVNNILHWSDEIYRLFGLVPQSFGATYDAFLNCVHPGDREFVKESVNNALYKKKPYGIDHRIVLPGGAERVVHEQAEVIFDATGKAIRMNGTVHDITERKRVEDEINLFHTITTAIAKAEDFQTALNVVLHKVCESTGWVYGEAWLPSPDGKRLDFDQAWYGNHENLDGFVKQSKTFNFLPEIGMPGRVWASGRPEWRHDTTVDGDFPRAKICVEYGFKAAMSIPVIANTKVIAVLVFFVRKRQNEDGRLIKLVSTVAVQLGAIVQRKKAEEELRRLSTVIDHSINTIFITDVKGTIEYVNPMFVQVTGYSKEEVIGQNPRILTSGETTHAEYEELWKTIAAGKTWRGVFKNKKKNGQYYWGNGVISPIRNDRGNITHFLAVQEDITEKMKSEERSRYLAAYDELTGLYNRAHFMTLLNDWILSAQNNNNKAGVILLVNIDKFRLNNDAYGHSAGDRLLHGIAGLLQNTLAEIDSLSMRKDAGQSFVGRMGGDEFAILLPFKGEKEGIAVAEHVRKKIEKFRAIEIAGNLTASIGVVLYPRHGVTINELFTKADAAVYLAKELGQNRTHLYHPEDRILEKMHSRMRWKEEIQRAIEEDRFVPWFQPILNLNNNEIHHYESLVRMCTQDGKIIFPSSFIDVAETLGLIPLIDRVVIEKTIKYLSNLNKKRGFPSFSINLSGKDFSDEGLFEYLKTTILETKVDTRRLIFEITETSAIRDLDSAIKFIKELRAIGCGISLDDFGVGFTSFRYLKELEVDYLKIDGSFIKNLHGDCHDQLFVKAIADVAKGMNIKTIAEFVEHEETMNILREFDINYAQGYFIGKPSPEIL